MRRAFRPAGAYEHRGACELTALSSSQVITRTLTPGQVVTESCALCPPHSPPWLTSRSLSRRSWGYDYHRRACRAHYYNSHNHVAWRSPERYHGAPFDLCEGTLAHSPLRFCLIPGHGSCERANNYSDR